MLAALALVLFQGQVAGKPLPELSDREVVALIPRFGERPWTDDAQSRLELVPSLKELRHRIESGKQLDIDCWHTILIDKGYLRWRTTWPISEPFAVSLHLPALAQGFAVRLAPTEEHWNEAHASHWEMMCGLGMDARWADEDYQVLGALHADQESAVFNLYVGPSWREACSKDALCVGQIRIDVRAVTSIDEVLERTTATPPSELIARQLTIEVSPRSDGHNACWLRARPNWPSTIACSLSVTLALRDKDVSTANVFIPARERGGFCELVGLRSLVVWGRVPADGWTIRCRGSTKDVLRNWDATQYWSGEFELTIAEILKR